jgi:tetratricopeptide (TPR) repeat protein
MKIKNLLFGLMLTGCLFTNMYAQDIVFIPQASGEASVYQKVGITDIKVHYSRPSVISPQGQDRTGGIWGQLVPYGYNNLGFGTATEAPWRAGANENTTIHFSTDVKIEGKDLKAGLYGFHVAVFEDGKATLIFSNDTQSWGSFFYDKAKDALRVDVQTIEIPQTNLLTYNFDKATNTEATLTLNWEKKQIPINIIVDTPELVYQNFTEELKGNAGFNIQSWLAAANYLVQNKIHLDEALVFANNAVEGQFYSQKDFGSLSTKAGVLSAMGKNEESQKVMDEALAGAGVSINNFYSYGRQLIGADKDAKALEIFKLANEKWPENWLAPHGLARGYAAIGDIKNALKYEKIAFEKAPENSKPFLEGYLKTLQEGKDFN